MDLLWGQLMKPSYCQSAVSISHVGDDLNEAFQIGSIPLFLLDDLIRHLL
jgi:hypothetical protein